MRNTRFKSWVTNRYFPEWSVIIAIGVASILAFGLLIPSLGYYFDDWPNVYVLYTQGDLWEYLKFDRPFSAWTFLVTAPILGVRPLNWHIFTLIIRCLVSIGMWWTFCQVWPQRKTEVGWMALLFAVHPVFTQQAIALTYSQNFLTYALYFLSMGSMFAAQQNRRWFWPLSVLAVTSTIVHIFTMEYFWGLEILRPVFIWLFLHNSPPNIRGRLKKTLRIWLPYGAVLMFAIIWREALYVSLFGLTESPNELKLLALFKTSPIQASFHLIEVALKDFSHVMFTTWHNTIKAELFDLGSNFSIISWTLVTTATVLSAIFLFRNRINPPLDSDDPHWAPQAMMAGLAVFIFGSAPIWAIGKNITLGKFSDRFALPAMLGAVIVTVAFLTYLKISRTHKIWIVSILIGLAIGSHFRTANEFRWASVKQQRFFWQMYWRAPKIMPDTPIFSDGSVLSYTGDYPTGFALNLLYSDGQAKPAAMPYWFFELDQDFQRNSRTYLRGQIVSDDLRNYVFTGSSLESLIIQFDYDKGSCLWIVHESHNFIADMPDLIRTALPMSDLSRIILTDQATISSPPEIIFGPEPEHTWCYFYQQAEIARSQENWEAIREIGDQVQNLDFSPNNKLEWVPFIEGMIRTAEWERAQDITISGFNSNPQMADTYCLLWQDLVTEVGFDEAAEEFVDAVYDTLRCHLLGGNK
jgi:hypothetical protein